MIRRFRKKPVEVQAIQWHRSKNTDEVRAILGEHFTASPDHLGKLGIWTLEGVMWADDGDWIIVGVKGEVYLCKPDIFAATYESVL